MFGTGREGKKGGRREERRMRKERGRRRKERGGRKKEEEEGKATDEERGRRKERGQGRERGRKKERRRIRKEEGKGEGCDVSWWWSGIPPPWLSVQLFPAVLVSGQLSGKSHCAVGIFSLFGIYLSMSGWVGIYP
jgi:hypothetical protein